jgi:hypothetical protein
VKEINDGKTSAAVGQEWATSLRVPIIPDVDAYKPRRGEKMFTLQMPEGTFGKACRLPFTEANGKLIEAWMDKYCIAARGDQLLIVLEDQGCVRLGVRRGGH